VSGSAWRIGWPHETIETHAEGGMKAPVEFHLRSGRVFSPLAVAPWAGDAMAPKCSGSSQQTRGVFPCLPFGVAPRPREASAAWAAITGAEAPEPPHGAAANGLWRRSGTSIVYAHGSMGGIASESQTVLTDASAPAVEIAHEARVRRMLRLPIGWHVIVRWPEEAGAIEPRLEPFAFGLTCPGIVEPGVMTTAPATELRDLAHVPAREGGLIDLARPAHPAPAEDVVQLCRIDGTFEVRYPLERAGLRVTWDARRLPSCLLWLSRRGLQEPPWCGRFTGIGIEPIAAAFDLHPEVSVTPNPISARGVATHVALVPDGPFATTLRPEAFAI
jgi:hypothetical protein